MAVKVDIFLDMSVYLEVLSDKFAQGINARVVRYARDFVAQPGHGHKYATGHLQGTIHAESTDVGEYRTVAETPYAKAQEWGRPDLEEKGIHYTFTPYMRPAAKKATTTSVKNEVFEEAKDAATRAAKR